MEINPASVAAKDPELSRDIVIAVERLRLAPPPTGQRLELYASDYTLVRRACGAKPGEPLFFRGVLLVEGVGRRRRPPDALLV